MINKLNSGETLHRKCLYSFELDKVEELDLSAYPVLVICRDMLMTQCRTGLKFAKMVNRAKRLDESVRGVYAAFLSVKKNAYVDGVRQLLDMAGLLDSTTGFVRAGSQVVERPMLISVTPDVGYYTYLDRCDARNSISLQKQAQTMKKILVAEGALNDVDVLRLRNHLTAGELNHIEEVDFNVHVDLYPIQNILLASCESLTTVNRMLSRSIVTYADPVYKMYCGDDDFYVEDLRALLKAAGIQTRTVIQAKDLDGKPFKAVDILEVTPYLGRYTFIHDELEPTNSK